MQPAERLWSGDKWDVRGVAARNYSKSINQSVNQSVSVLSIGHSWDIKLHIGLPVSAAQTYLIWLLNAQEVVSGRNNFNLYLRDSSSNLGTNAVLWLKHFSISFPHSNQENSVHYLNSDNDRFLPNPSQFKKQTNSVALSPRAKYTDWRPPLVDEL
jgi:hypothetical protein